MFETFNENYVIFKLHIEGLVQNYCNYMYLILYNKLQ